MTQYSEQFYYNRWQMIGKEGAVFVYATSKSNSFRFGYNGCTYKLSNRVDFIQLALEGWVKKLNLLYAKIQEVVQETDRQQAIIRRYQKLQSKQVFVEMMHGLKMKIDHLSDESLGRLVQILNIYHEQYRSVLGEDHATYETINDAFGFLNMYPSTLEEFILNLSDVEQTSASIQSYEDVEMSENIKIKIKSSYSGLSDYAQPSLFAA